MYRYISQKKKQGLEVCETNPGNPIILKQYDTI